MNEITHIHLGRQPFTIAVDAHRALRAYIAEIEPQVGKNKDVIEEIELRMAELLGERGVTAEKVVLMGDVDYLKQQLGEPSDFTDDEKTEKHEDASEPAGDKRLFRDPEHGMVAGVAAGLGAYLKIDSIIIRLIFVLLTFSGGAGVLVYVLLWLLVPPVKSGSDRLQMNGRPVTVENIKETVNQADVPGVASRTGKTVVHAGAIITKIILAIVGISFIVWGVGVLLGLITAATYLVVHGVELGNKVLFPIGGKELLVVACGTLVGAMIAALAILVGKALVRRKWGVPAWALAALIGVFVISAAVGTATGFDAGPAIDKRYQAAQHVEWRTLPAFTKVHLHASNLEYSYIGDARNAVEIRTVGPANTSTITTKVVKGELTVNSEGYVPQTTCHFVCPFGNDNVEVIIHGPPMFSGDEWHAGVDAPSLEKPPVPLANPSDN
jgi:phage shock protein PspC (stress-responsive transcriptional regulator)